MHRLDPRCKIAILAVYSCALLFVDDWIGMALMGAIFVAALIASAIAPYRVFRCGSIVYVLAAFAVLFGAFSAGGDGIAFSVRALCAGCLNALRILLLFWMSLLICFTTASSALIAGLTKLLQPLRAFRVPVDDVALVLSLSLRFIPLTAQEYISLKLAQRARAARFDSGSLWQRLCAQGAVFAPLFVMLFRRADKLSLAMEARCYGLDAGAPVSGRTSLHGMRASPSDVLGSLIACACSIAACLVS